MGPLNMVENGRPVEVLHIQVRPRYVLPFGGNGYFPWHQAYHGSQWPSWPGNVGFRR